MTENQHRQKFEFYDPHPGFAGAMVPLPQHILEVVRDLDGKIMTLEEALERISPASRKIGGRVEVLNNPQYIGFEFDQGHFTHSYCLIKYREVN